MENNMIQINPVAFHLLGLPVRWYAINYCLRDVTECRISA